MNETELRQIARKLMDEHGLQHWDLKIGSAKRTAGHAYFPADARARHHIRLSKVVAAINPTETTVDTILHEIAHAIAGREAGHGPIWKRIAREIGATPNRTASLKSPTPKWVGKCSNCGHTTQPRNRRTRVACAKCCRNFNGGTFTEDFLIRWVANPNYTG